MTGRPRNRYTNKQVCLYILKLINQKLTKNVRKNMRVILGLGHRILDTGEIVIKTSFFIFVIGSENTFINIKLHVISAFSISSYFADSPRISSISTMEMCPQPDQIIRNDIKLTFYQDFEKLSDFDFCIFQSYHKNQLFRFFLQVLKNNGDKLGLKTLQNTMLMI